MQSKMSKVTKDIEAKREEGQLSEDQEKEIMGAMAEDMKTLMIDTLWYMNKMDIADTVNCVLKKLFKTETNEEVKLK